MIKMGRCLLLLFFILYTTNAAVKEKKVHHLKDLKFDEEEYFDPVIDERETGPDYPISPFDQPMRKRVNLSYSSPSVNNISDKLSPSIKWDSRWPFYYEVFGQISAVSIHPNGNIAIFHRGERTWDASTFGRDNKFNIKKGPIGNNTIILLSKDGDSLLEWGKNMFYLPHGLTIDSFGNYWITDVAMHQVFKFDAQDVERIPTMSHSQRIINSVEKIDVNNLFANSIIKPSLILGQAFQPGNDNIRFCKPTAVAVMSNGDFFVSDGYCNARVIKFNSKGERIMQWGRTWGFDGKALYENSPPPNTFLIPHALALAEEYDFIFVADRENARVVCNFANNGSFHREYKNPAFGEAIYSIAYANGHLYLVNGNHYTKNSHVRGFVLDIHTGELLFQFAPFSDMDSPHDIAVSDDERQIYVVELNNRKIYKFDQDVRKLKSAKLTKSSVSSSNIDSVSIEKPESHRFLAIGAIIAALSFIAVCLLLAVLLARYQKRGCLFPPQRRRSNNFKLSGLLETRGRFKIFERRPNSREFSKLNTEPETSDDENAESSLEKII